MTGRFVSSERGQLLQIIHWEVEEKSVSKT